LRIVQEERDAKKKEEEQKALEKEEQAAKEAKEAKTETSAMGEQTTISQDESKETVQENVVPEPTREDTENMELEATPMAEPQVTATTATDSLEAIQPEPMETPREEPVQTQIQPQTTVTGVDMQTETTQSQGEAPAQAQQVQSSVEPQTPIAPAGVEAIDPSFLEALPEDVREEVLAFQLATTSAAASTTNTTSHSVNPEFLAALPHDLQLEVLEQERREQERLLRQANPDTSRAQDMDVASFIATLSNDLREEALLSISDEVLLQLPPEIAAEVFCGQLYILLIIFRPTH
jgi:E3 ubiquitin-protein ligase HUWE1